MTLHWADRPDIINKLHGLWNPEIQCRIQRDSRISLSWAESTQFFVLTLISLRSILILPYQLRLGLPKGLFPAGVPVNILKSLLYTPILATWPAHLNLLDLIILAILGERWNYKEHVTKHLPVSNLIPMPTLVTLASISHPISSLRLLCDGTQAILPLPPLSLF